ncbi:MAG TPA: InlB B-repeat-containing protein, partial [Geothrix sp.]
MQSLLRHLRIPSAPGRGPWLRCLGLGAALLLSSHCGGGGGGNGSGGPTPQPAQTCTVTFLAGTGGSLVGSTSQTIASGASCTAVTAVPDPGYTFTTWIGAGFTSNAASPLTVTNVTQNLTITATFTQQTFTVTFVAGAGGSITGSSSQIMAYGGSATAVSAVPNVGYTFTNWTGPGFTTTNATPLTVTNVTQNLTITATFTQQTFIVTFVAGAGGSMTGTTTQTVAYGGSATSVSAVPSVGYTFTNWTGAGFTTTNANP